jgi:integrase
MRELLRDYILILANTGMRHGTEAQNLRWKNISTFEMDGRSYAIVVPLLDKLLAVIDTLITAVRNGELDDQLAHAAKQATPKKRKAA